MGLVVGCGGVGMFVRWRFRVGDALMCVVWDAGNVWGCGLHGLWMNGFAEFAVWDCACVACDVLVCSLDLRFRGVGSFGL